MLPHSVLHKRNGHRHLPHSGIASAGELVNLVHSAPEQSSELSRDLLKFAIIAQSERPSDSDELFGEGVGISPAVAQALSRSRDAFARGELADIRASLDALRAQAALAADVIARLTEVIRVSDARPYAPSGRRLLNVNDLLLQVVDAPSGLWGDNARVTLHLDPEVPSVAGDPAQVAELLRILLSALARESEGSDAPGEITAETSHRDGVLRGEKVIRVALLAEHPYLSEPADSVHGRRPGPDPAADIDRAARIAKEHGGILFPAAFAAGHGFTLDLPAV
jgi:hypothetical protein